MQEIAGIPPTWSPLIQITLAVLMFLFIWTDIVFKMDIICHWLPAKFATEEHKF